MQALGSANAIMALSSAAAMVLITVIAIRGEHAFAKELRTVNVTRLGAVAAMAIFQFASPTVAGQKHAL